jgi:phosphatidylserine/phosphatidylglycerophosphate/cardiolipin synthase-like enzyme
MDCPPGHTLFLGSLSYSYNSSTFNREVGLVITGKEAVGRVKDQFEKDWMNASTPLSAVLA